MRIVIDRTKDAAARRAAAWLARAVRREPALVVALPTGRTPVPFYRALVESHRRHRLSLRRATTFNLDELHGLAAEDPGSYHAYMRRHLFDHVDLPAARRHLPDGAARVWRREVARYEARIAAAGGLDVAVVGIGRNGHVGFNEPASRLSAATHRVRLSRSSREANAYLFGGDVRRVPAYALSMGIGTILRARRIVLLATGESKAAVLARALEGPVTTRLPASLLRAHPDVTVFADRSAAAHLGRPIRSGSAAS